MRIGKISGHRRGQARANAGSTTRATPAPPRRSPRRSARGRRRRARSIARRTRARRLWLRWRRRAGRDPTSASHPVVAGAICGYARGQARRTCATLQRGVIVCYAAHALARTPNCDESDSETANYAGSRRPYTLPRRLLSTDNPKAHGLVTSPPGLKTTTSLAIFRASNEFRLSLALRKRACYISPQDACYPNGDCNVTPTHEPQRTR